LGKLIEGKFASLIQIFVCRGKNQRMANKAIFIYPKVEKTTFGFNRRITLTSGTIECLNETVSKLYIDTSFGTVDKSGPVLSKTTIPTEYPLLCRPVNIFITTRSAPPPENRGNKNKIWYLSFNLLKGDVLIQFYYRL
jgi:hypothetical protein